MKAALGNFHKETGAAISGWLKKNGVFPRMEKSQDFPVYKVLPSQRKTDFRVLFIKGKISESIAKMLEEFESNFHRADPKVYSREALATPKEQRINDCWWDFSQDITAQLWILNITKHSSLC
ncbi:hypothetical protein Y1Q_0013047 [Alligator mississippiensis]|uniref:Uncharacterized protein n=1 Tax=Alligator mississippiensis TaxID=8496 RepID=A0A151N6W3_ALLMI|nr:hypothetical protein Y1Q_0013047 [Alligator mississippiensis]